MGESRREGCFVKGVGERDGMIGPPFPIITCTSHFVLFRVSWSDLHLFILFSRSTGRATELQAAHQVNTRLQQGIYR